MSTRTYPKKRPASPARLGVQTSVSRRKAAGGKRNKKHRFVGSFQSDRA